jgi:CubicO group peptidase (beta-lactamase class C family)
MAVTYEGGLAYYQALGFRDPETTMPMPQDAIFSIASMTRPMDSVTVMMLRDDGRLFLSDPVGKYLPALAKMQVATIKPDCTGEKRMKPSQPNGSRRS